jgi:DNA repair photolyase
MTKDTKKTGTKEWAETNVNCLKGCEHDCRYCYARANASRFKQIATAEEWRQPQVNQKAVAEKRKKYEGIVMFPSTHDLTPRYMTPCLDVLDKLLVAGNQVLVVTKPHFTVIQRICMRRNFKEQIKFRFSIGSCREEILEYWEPGAPTFGERYECLQYAFRQGFSTSVSCEPLLDPFNINGLFRRLEPWVSDTIWFGCMNDIRRRCVAGTDPERINIIERGQTAEHIRSNYSFLKTEPKVRWKDSYKKVLGLS